MSKKFEKRVLRELEEVGDAVKGFCKEWMDMTQCRKHIRVSKSTLYGMVSRKEIPFYRLKKRILFNTDEINAWIEKNCRVKSEAEIESDVSTSILKKKMRGVR